MVLKLVALFYSYIKKNMVHQKIGSEYTFIPKLHQLAKGIIWLGQLGDIRKGIKKQLAGKTTKKSNPLRIITRCKYNTHAEPI